VITLDVRLYLRLSELITGFRFDFHGTAGAIDGVLLLLDDQVIGVRVLLVVVGSQTLT
jgi:hypothetical protein